MWASLLTQTQMVSLDFPQAPSLLLPSLLLPPPCDEFTRSILDPLEALVKQLPCWCVLLQYKRPLQQNIKLTTPVPLQPYFPQHSDLALYSPTLCTDSHRGSTQLRILMRASILGLTPMWRALTQNNKSKAASYHSLHNSIPNINLS